MCTHMHMVTLLLHKVVFFFFFFFTSAYFPRFFSSAGKSCKIPLFCSTRDNSHSKYEGILKIRLADDHFWTIKLSGRVKRKAGCKRKPGASGFEFG